MPPSSSNLFIVHSRDGEPIIDAVERALTNRSDALANLPALTNVALGDPYLAAQLAALHQQWTIQPAPANSLLARIRTRVAWWLLGTELQHITRVNGTIVRILDSLIVQLDEERAARRRFEEQRAYDGEQP